MAVISQRILSKQQALELSSEALALLHDVGGKGKLEAVLLEGLVDRHRDLQKNC